MEYIFKFRKMPLFISMLLHSIDIIIVVSFSSIIHTTIQLAMLPNIMFLFFKYIMKLATHFFQQPYAKKCYFNETNRNYYSYHHDAAILSCKKLVVFEMIHCTWLPFHIKFMASSFPIRQAAGFQSNKLLSFLLCFI